MIQFYFLSILFNIIAGLVLIYGRSLSGSDSSDLSLSDSSGSEFDALDVDSSDSQDSAFSESMGESQGGSSDESGKDFPLINNATFRLVVGILCVFVGLIKLLSPVGTPFVGDLLPAVAGIFVGFSLLIEFYESSSGELSLPDVLRSVLIDSRKYLGVVCIIVAVLHFVLPRVLFL